MPLARVFTAPMMCGTGNPCPVFGGRLRTPLTASIIGRHRSEPERQPWIERTGSDRSLSSAMPAAAFPGQLGDDGLMRYIGSKSATLPWLSRTVASRAPGAASICDPFAGTCTVARHFKGMGMHVVTGDVLQLSHVLQIATVGCDAPPPFEGLVKAGLVRGGGTEGTATRVLAYLQALASVEGYVYREFSPAGEPGRWFFTPENASRIDAIRDKVAAWERALLINSTESAVLRASLIEAADRVANTAGTYYAYLKTFCRKARQPLRLALPPTTRAGSSGGCYNSDAQEVVAASRTDILYLDPPYNQRDYAGYYHLPETLARGDAPQARGRSGTPPPRMTRSDFYRTTCAADALAQLCSKARARHIVVHYTTEGIIPHRAIIESLRARGRVSFRDRPVRAYSSCRSGHEQQAWHRLYWCDVRDGEF